MAKGCIHIYCGEGKGKTTAAFGLALRALGCDISAWIYQFLKPSPSGEALALAHFERARVLRAQESPNTPFLWEMNAQERAQCLQKQRELFNMVFECPADLIVLDEIFAAIQSGAIAEDALLRLLDEKQGSAEIILTGRNPGETVLKRADYITDMQKVRHPYDCGIHARRGIEY